jgi:hypothetical protein
VSRFRAAASATDVRLIVSFAAAKGLPGGPGDFAPYEAPEYVGEELSPFGELLEQLAEVLGSHRVIRRVVVGLRSAWRCSQTRSGVSGRSWITAPVASVTAAASAGAVHSSAPSLTPLDP